MEVALLPRHAPQSGNGLFLFDNKLTKTIKKKEKIVNTGSKNALKTWRFELYWQDQDIMLLYY